LLFPRGTAVLLSLQLDYDLDIAEDALVKRLDREVKTYAVGA